MSRRFAPILAPWRCWRFPLPPPRRTPRQAPAPGAPRRDGEDRGRQPGRSGRAEIYDHGPGHRHDRALRRPASRSRSTFYLDGKPLVSQKVAVSKGGGDTGKFSSSVIVREDGKYAVSATHEATAVLGADSTVRKSWKVSFPALHQGECGDVVVGFKKAMRKMGYIANGGSLLRRQDRRGVLAYRKVNGMSRSPRAGAGLVKSVFAGKGGYHVRYPDAGEHVEAPLYKQVLVFAKGDKPFAIYPVSSGKSSTPTVTGHFSSSAGTGLQLARDVLLVLLLRRLRGARLRIGARLPRQPRLPAHLHRRPARDLQPHQLRRRHLHLVTAAALGKLEAMSGAVA